MRGLSVVLFLAACGGDGGGNKPDAPGIDIDAAVEIDAPGTTATCSFTEAADATNNTSPGAEATMVAFAGTKSSICGSINNGHFNMTQRSVDNDAYKFSTAADTDVLIHLTGTGVETLGRVVLLVGTTTGMGRNVGLFEGDHGTVSVRLPAGEHVVAVSAFNQADITAAIPYKLTIVTDMPATRCAKVTAAASYTEANDGAANDGNDVILFSQAANPTTSLTTSATDAPENSGIMAAPGTNYRITGSSANVNRTDDYMDRDMFAFQTSATTTQLSIRLNWTATTIDYDYRLFPMGSLLTVTGGLLTANTEDEFQTFAVKPSTTYGLWIGAYDGSTGLPAAYDATICAETFTP